MLDPQATPLQLWPRKIKITWLKCILYESTIVDDDESNKGDDAIFCEGEYQIWLHIKCVGLTKNAFTLIGKSKDPYLCPYCNNNHYKKEISELKELVKSFSTKLYSLENQINPTDSALGADSVSNQVCNQSSHKKLSQSSQSGKSPPHQSTTSFANKPPTSLPDNPVDWKFNLVIYGIKENPKGTERRAWTKSDVEKCKQILKQADDDISVHLKVDQDPSKSNNLTFWCW